MQPLTRPPSAASCQACLLRRDRRFCNLPPEALQLLDGVATPVSFTPHSVLFTEGQPATGLYVICDGQVKLSASSDDGRTIILSLAPSGSVLGLSGVISQSEYEVTAEAEILTKTKYVAAKDFHRLLESRPEVGVKVAQTLTHTCQEVIEEFKSFTLSTSVPQRLAKLILHWEQESKLRPKMRVACTHEEIAQMLGTARETVSRALGKFKADGILEIRGSIWLVRDQDALHRAAAGKFTK